jgi:hypothetical protein
MSPSPCMNPSPRPSKSTRASADVSWTGADPGFTVLSAQVSFRGRGLAIFSRTFPKSRKCSPRAEREFLEAMRAISRPT